MDFPSNVSFDALTIGETIGGPGLNAVRGDSGGPWTAVTNDAAGGPVIAVTSVNTGSAFLGAIANRDWIWDTLDPDGDCELGSTTTCQIPGFGELNDQDGDGLPDVRDLCPDVAPLRTSYTLAGGGTFDCGGNHCDHDGDFVGDECDLFDGVDHLTEAADPSEPRLCNYDDLDRDSIPDEVDICPTVPASRTTTSDIDADGVPDSCDRCPGADDALATDVDLDGDGIPDDCELCPGAAQPERRNCNLDWELSLVDAVGDDGLVDRNGDGIEAEPRFLGDSCDPNPCPDVTPDRRVSRVPSSMGPLFEDVRQSNFGLAGRGVVELPGEGTGRTGFAFCPCPGALDNNPEARELCRAAAGNCPFEASAFFAGPGVTDWARFGPSNTPRPLNAADELPMQFCSPERGAVRARCGDDPTGPPGGTLPDCPACTYCDFSRATDSDLDGSPTGRCHPSSWIRGSWNPLAEPALAASIATSSTPLGTVLSAELVLWSMMTGDSVPAGNDGFTALTCDGGGCGVRGGQLENSHFFSGQMREETRLESTNPWATEELVYLWAYEPFWCPECFELRIPYLIRDCDGSGPCLSYPVEIDSADLPSQVVPDWLDPALLTRLPMRRSTGSGTPSRLSCLAKPEWVSSRCGGASPTHRSSRAATEATRSTSSRPSSESGRSSSEARRSSYSSARPGPSSRSRRPCQGQRPTGSSASPTSGLGRRRQRWR